MRKQTQITQIRHEPVGDGMVKGEPNIVFDIFNVSNQSVS